MERGWLTSGRHVQVTLDICEALIEKCSKDMTLFAPSILTVLAAVLRAGDVSLTEHSLKCFAAFCKHHDGTNLSSDQAYVNLFEDVLTLYANFASTPQQPFELRWRSIGLQAVKLIASSEALAAGNSQKQLDLIAPVIIRNLFSESEEKLEILRSRAQSVEDEDEDDKGLTLNRVLTSATIAEGATVAAEVSDKLEEEDIGVLALQSLKRIFETDSNSHISASADAVFRVICSLDPVSERWATALVEMIARWAPVQHSYLILTRCQGMLVNISDNDQTLQKQVLLAGIMCHLLSSSVNLIGLSVMDVLAALLQHTSQLLRHESLSGTPSQSPTGLSTSNTPRSSNGEVNTGISTLAATHLRHALLEKLEKCIGDLATHIYYSDQIADMVAEILLHLKPTSSSMSGSPNHTQQDLSAGKDSPTVGFGGTLARRVGLRALKSILVIADRKGETSGVGRHKVPMRVWEGSHWMIRDEDVTVRRAYIDAFVTWLRLEVGDASQTATTPGGSKPRADGAPSPPRRRLSAPSAWHHLPPVNPASPSTFLKRLHIAIYQQALAHSTDTAEIMALHLLLTSLVEYIGFNAALCALPMLGKLVQDVEGQGDKAVIYVGSLWLGYLSVCGKRLGLKGVETRVEKEIEKRKERAQWFYGIKTPAVTIAKITAPLEEKHNYISAPTEPFTILDTLVEDLINHLASPSFAQASTPLSPKEKDLPSAATLRELFASEWTVEAILASLEQGSRQGSLAESKLLTGGTVRSYLNLSSLGSPLNGNGTTNGLALNSGNGIASTTLERFRLAQGAALSAGTRTTRSSSSRESTVRIDELKRALRTAEIPRSRAGSSGSEDSDDSMLSVSRTLDGAFSSVEHSPARPGTAPASHHHLHGRRERERGGRPPATSAGPREGRVPPVPPLPSLDLPGTFPQDTNLNDNPHKRSPLTSALNSATSVPHDTSDTHSLRSSRTSPRPTTSSQTSPGFGTRHVYAAYADGTLAGGRVDPGLLLVELGREKKRSVSLGRRPGTAVGGGGGFRPPY